MQLQDVQMPNLDDATEDELTEYIIQFKRLGECAQLKRAAINNRREGDIPRAISLEQSCDRKYHDLPDEFKW